MTPDRVVPDITEALELANAPSSDCAGRTVAAWILIVFIGYERALEPFEGGLGQVQHLDAVCNSDALCGPPTTKCSPRSRSSSPDSSSIESLWDLFVTYAAPKMPRRNSRRAKTIHRRNDGRIPSQRRRIARLTKSNA